ncbi:unnamed protein product [Rhodiola kirilowii]
MAVRTVNAYSLIRSASCSTNSLVRPHHVTRHATAERFTAELRLGFRFCGGASHVEFVRVQTYSVHSLVDLVMAEFTASRRRTKVRASSAKLGIIGSVEVTDDKVEKRVLQRGLLVEFKKDSERVMLAVVLKPDGKKNWVVTDQNGVMSSIKPQQVTYIIPGVKDVDHAEITSFVHKAYDNLDPALLEFAWSELLENNKSVTVDELAKIIFGSDDPLESYCAHLLLSKDDIYFTVLETKGYSSIYGPRPTIQVEELIRRKRAKEGADKELEKITQLLKSAKAMSLCEKPSKSSWKLEEIVWKIISSLEANAVDACENVDQKKTAGMILKAMGLPKTSSSAIDLLIDIGYFPVHINLDLLKYNIRTDHPEDVRVAAESLLSDSPDVDKVDRIDLTNLKVYAIDVDEADELDDALSATRLQDGRIKIWIHVADPTRFVVPGSKGCNEKRNFYFLAHCYYPMFPEKLAMEGMSLRQGHICNSVTVSVILRDDGSIAEYSIFNSTIRPTYMLTYESASELLHLSLEEESELKILSEAATLPFAVAPPPVDVANIETRIKVANPEDPDPPIKLYVENQSDPAMRLVSEMMILCGEAVATYGCANNIPLPYRGQPQSNIDPSAFAHLPEGPVRSSALVKIMRAAEMDFRKPVRHGILGIPGYVQFTSPIRRYMDLLAHYQVKAFLRGESLPFTAGQLEGMASMVNMNTRIAKKLFSSSLRYWMLEYMKRQPKERRFTALILRFIKDRIAALLLVEVGLQSSAWVSVGKQIGDEVEVRVEESHPRDDILSLKEV